ncbi:antitoxin Xre/MbcA/ParS toxin-binding domain-containing protein [Pseudomonas sp. Marseille-Q5115]|uniref:antitoxin Xre/MbcA/ParS toxin-binding domain-containing protein n=1 Tax=Pseudomonas sp. Marseille-Q5115 TaxID=2866593 RepID=UPI001CE448AF|nr:antitoxin Xre/MbcA/ParS toxin-binding domain-containing protein [Pseudomonas sp. Marseille-Q5115]
MHAEILREPAYFAYRTRLEALLEIPASASDQRIHELIEMGFPASRVKTLADEGTISPLERDHIIPLKTLKSRLTKGQPLTVDESDRLFRSAHIAAMAQALFGDDAKARRWLTKPKERFGGKTPVAMLSTIQGTRQVEEALVQLAEGFAF